MRLSVVAKPATKERLEAVRQIGAEDVVYYSIEDRAAIFDQFGAFVERAKAADLRASVVEAGPPIGKIVMGEDGWREQTDDWVDAIRLLASHGVEVICYNFMPQVFDDAMVVRTSFETKTRGGAITSSYRAIDIDHETLVDADVLPISKDEMRANLKRFLDEVIPIAEEVGIKLAMHPDDPPISPMGGLRGSCPASGLTGCLLPIRAKPWNYILHRLFRGARLQSGRTDRSMERSNSLCTFP